MISASAAREVLSRCEYILNGLRQEPTGIAWEVKFSAALALLRSVGHVLKKTDSPTSSALKNEIDRWWKEIMANKSKHPIFWEFVEQERNLILKENQVRAGQSAMIFLQGVSATGIAAGQEPPPAPTQTNTPKAIYSYHMNEGPFIGRDPRDLIEDAIRWWHEQIINIEKRANTP